MIRREELEGPPRLWDLVEALLRRKWLILAVAIPVIAAMALYTFSRAPVYTAKTQILVRPPLWQLTTPPNPNSISAETETSVATSSAVANIAQQLMNSRLTPLELLPHESAAMTQGAQVLTISFSDLRPSVAQKGAAAFGAAYLRYRQEQALRVVANQSASILSAVRTVETQIRALSQDTRNLPPGSPQRLTRETKLQVLNARSLALQNQLASLRSLTIDPGEVIDPANRPTSPTSPKHVFDLAIGIILGLGLAIAVALVKERTSEVVRSPADLEDRLGAPVLASIPRAKRNTKGRKALVVGRGHRTLAADGYRRLRTGLLGLAPSREMKSLLFTSARGGEAKTAAVANLGVGLAEIGRRVILISADLYAPHLNHLFASDGKPGLIQVLNNDTSTAKAIIQTAIPNLRLVPTGTPSVDLEPANLLQMGRIKELLSEWRDDADFVLLDAPGVLVAPDTLVLAPFMDGVVFVADAWKTTWDEVARGRDQVERAGGVVVGGVLNGVDISLRDRRAWRIESQLWGVHQRLFFGHKPEPSSTAPAAERHSEATAGLRSLTPAEERRGAEIQTQDDSEPALDRRRREA